MSSQLLNLHKKISETISDTFAICMTFQHIPRPVRVFVIRVLQFCDCDLWCDTTVINWWVVTITTAPFISWRPEEIHSHSHLDTLLFTSRGDHRENKGGGGWQQKGHFLNLKGHITLPKPTPFENSSDFGHFIFRFRSPPPFFFSFSLLLLLNMLCPL